MNDDPMIDDPSTGLSPDLPTTAVADELVVYLPHQEIVTRWLGEHGTPVTRVIASDQRLGLARLGIDLGKQTIDTVLRNLRTYYEHKYHQWVPQVGKNRDMANPIIGMPETRPHGDGPPELAATPAAVPMTERGRGVRVGILDTKIFDHPDLTGRFVADHAALWRASGRPVPSRAGHATFIAGLVLRRAPATELHVADVLTDDGDGTVWDLATKLLALAEDGLQVVNLSLGCRTEDNKPPLVLRRAVELISSQVVVVASAGNHGARDEHAQPVWPAALPDVVAVGATDENGGYADYSPKAPWVTCTTPGTATSTYLKAKKVTTSKGEVSFDGYAVWRGTSFAAATVTGAIAAETVPGKVSARDALRDLLDNTASVVTRYVPPS